MALAKKCDRCGKLYEHYPMVEVGFCYNAVGLYHVNSNGTVNKAYKLKDLCPECMTAYDKFITMKEDN